MSRLTPSQAMEQFEYMTSLGAEYADCKKFNPDEVPMREPSTPEEKAIVSKFRKKSGGIIFAVAAAFLLFGIAVPFMNKEPLQGKTIVAMVFVILVGIAMLVFGIKSVKTKARVIEVEVVFKQKERKGGDTNGYNYYVTFVYQKDANNRYIASRVPVSAADYKILTEGDTALLVDCGSTKQVFVMG